MLRVTIDREECKTVKQKENKVSYKVVELPEEEIKWLTDEESIMAAWNEKNTRNEFKRQVDDGVRDERFAKKKKLLLLAQWLDRWCASQNKSVFSYIL